MISSSKRASEADPTPPISTNIRSTITLGARRNLMLRGGHHCGLPGPRTLPRNHLLGRCAKSLDARSQLLPAASSSGGSSHASDLTKRRRHNVRRNGSAKAVRRSEVDTRRRPLGPGDALLAGLQAPRRASRRGKAPTPRAPRRRTLGGPVSPVVLRWRVAQRPLRGASGSSSPAGRRQEWSWSCLRPMWKHQRSARRIGLNLARRSAPAPRRVSRLIQAPRTRVP